MDGTGLLVVLQGPVRSGTNRSGASVIQSEVDIKSWLARTPTVGEVLNRPAKCPTCKAPSCPVGGRIQLHGHGVRERDVCGPPGPGEKPERTTLTARRYL